MLSHSGGFAFDLWSEPGVKLMMDDLAAHYLKEDATQNFWLDCDEPCGGSSWLSSPSDSTKTVVYKDRQWPAQLVGAAYPARLSAVTIDGLRARGASAPVVLGRSSWAGGHTTAAMVWNGDRMSSFSDMQKCWRSGLHAGVSGLYYWTTDIGGYGGHPGDGSRTNNPNDGQTCCPGVLPGASASQLEACCDNNVSSPAFRELIVRWYQMGVTHPIFRTHGHRMGGPPGTPAFSHGDGASSTNEAWNFGPEAYASIRAVMLLRESLRPYIAEQFAKIVSDGVPITRPLLWDFPSDPQIKDSCSMSEDCASETQAMFGPELMIAPQLHLGATSRSVYLPLLPEGGDWQDFFTNASLGCGGNTISQPTPLHSGTFPLFRRVGSSGPPGPPPPPAPPSPPPSPSPQTGYDDMGRGFCTGKGKRPQTYLCDTTGGKQGCPSTSAGCGKVCTATPSCAGFMTQTMGTDPSTCNLVSAKVPSGSGTWVIQQAGNGFAIDGHDSETRDHCWRKSGGKAAPPGYADLGSGYCTDNAGTRPEGYLCWPTAAKSACSFTVPACAALCTADVKCAGFMLQNMSIYGDPPTCSLVTTNAPTAQSGQQWSNQNKGKGLAIDTHDGETRDRCYKREYGPIPP